MIPAFKFSYFVNGGAERKREAVEGDSQCQLLNLFIAKCFDTSSFKVHSNSVIHAVTVIDELFKTRNFVVEENTKLRLKSETQRKLVSIMWWQATRAVIYQYIMSIAFALPSMSMMCFILTTACCFVMIT